jgi:hypothetical protein
VVALVFDPVLHRVANRAEYRDFQKHAEMAERTAAAGRFESPHVLYEALVIAVAALRPRPRWLDTGVHVALAAQLALALVLAAALERALPRTAPAAPALAAALALGLMTAGPLTFATWPQRNLYDGYVAVNACHNPTMLLLRPLALAHWLMLAGAFTSRRRSAPGLAALALLGVASVLAKPSYALALLPALAVVAGGRWWRGRDLDARAVVLGAALPLALALGAQFLLAYDHEKSAIVWAPLEAMRLFPGSPARLLSSLLYPAVATAVCFRAARRSPVLALAWLTFGVGAGYAYLLAETGPRAGHANFLWSAQIGVFLLFVTATLLVLEQASAARRWGRPLACAAAFLPHLVSGAFFLRHPTWL